jgi:SAM-dependent methyltransferase
MKQDRDYLLGTHDDEISRLGLQHRVWGPRTLDAWRRAGFTVGQTLLDIGCGPGYASVDLAEIVGPSGKVVAIDRSRRFLDTLEATQRQRGLVNIRTFELDLDEAELPAVEADGAWCRWVFAFMKQPRKLLERVVGRLKRGSVLVSHEYFNYSTWQLAPRLPEIEEFVRVVTESWRADGGEPNVGLNLPVWLNELGFEIKTLNPIIEIVPKTNYLWEWPKAFIHVGLRRMVDLGRMTSERAREISDAFTVSEAAPHTLMITPAVLEIVAMRK